MQAPKTRSEFTKAAFLISQEINDTLGKLNKLTVHAKKRSMFEDKPNEINELIYVIKQEIAKINHQISQLSEYLGREKDKNSQQKEHSHNIITSLQSKLANTSDAFKSVLKVRSENLKLQKSRKEQYSAGEAVQNRDSPLYHPEKSSLSNSPNPQFNNQPQQWNNAQSQWNTNSNTWNSGNQWNQDPPPDQTVIDFGNTSFTQQLLVEPSNSSSYLEQRDQAIESIESTIQELGQVYSRFASVLAEQREMVQRIDENIGNVHENVEGAHAQLLKYYGTLSQNRGLVLKSFGVMLVFFTAFVMLG